MALFRKSVYDRAACLARAARAERRGRPQRAVAEYRQVLEREPENSALQSKLAAALARSGQQEAAEAEFAACAERYEKQGFDSKALALYHCAAGLLPKRDALWAQLARLELQRGHAADAVVALLKGRGHCRRRCERPAAIRLLRHVLAIEPEHAGASLDLAVLLRKQGEGNEARELCEALCQRARGRVLRRARWALLRLDPGAGSLWRWLRAVLLGR